MMTCPYAEERQATSLCRTRRVICTGQARLRPVTGRDGLRMEPKLTLDLARRAAELVVQRIEKLPDDTAWEGEFKQGLEDQLMQDPPEEGRPAEEVLEWAVRDILPIATRLDHPRCFGFVPTSPT